MVSVAVITYNQEHTISQALDSILCQQGEFDLEVVVGEDASTDGTRMICEKYASLYPQKIKLLSGDENLGIVGNFVRVIKACRGDYIAILAGDDYWCDNRKLQKQLDYAVANPQYGVVYSDGYQLFVRSGRLVSGLTQQNPNLDGDVRGYYHNRYGGVYCVPLTMLIRRDLLQYVDFDEFVRRGFPVEDYPMQCILAHHTSYGYIPDKTAVYRVYQESATFIPYDSPKYMDYHKGLVEIRRYLHKLYPEDVPFTDEWASDYLFYKEFLLLLYRGEFTSARLMVANYNQNTPHYRRGKFATRTILHFYAFKVYKSIISRVKD